jgi:hypothetical protein
MNRLQGVNAEIVNVERILIKFWDMELWVTPALVIEVDVKVAGRVPIAEDIKKKYPLLKCYGYDPYRRKPYWERTAEKYYSSLLNGSCCTVSP